MIRAKTLAKGIASYIPGMNSLLSFPATPEPDEAVYCYGVWLKHLTLLHETGAELPETVVELGPGNSLGVGLCALLSGAERYYGLDAVPLVRFDSLPLFERLVSFFRERRPKEPGTGWPDYGRYLDKGFPHHILTEEVLDHALSRDRLAYIRKCLVSGGSPVLNYAAPWCESDVPACSVDLVMSHVVLEYVNDIPALLAAQNKWLKLGGVISHQMQLTSHGLTREWNGQYTVPRSLFALARGRRPYFINRLTPSDYIRMAGEAGFSVSTHLRRFEESGIAREKLAHPFQDMSEEDLTTSGLFLQAEKVEELVPVLHTHAAFHA